MPENNASFFSDKLSPIIRSILKQMSEKKIKLTDQSLYEALSDNNEFNELFSNSCSTGTPARVLIARRIESLKEYIRDENLNKLSVKLSQNASDEEAFDIFYDMLISQIAKSEKRLSAMAEFVETLFNKVLSAQDKMTGSLESNIRFVEEDISKEKEIFRNAEEIESILREEGIIFPGKPLKNFIEAFDERLTSKKDMLDSMTDSYVKIEAELGEYKKEVAQLNEDIRKYRLETITDHLTGVYNRKYLDIKLAEEIDRFARYAQPFCIFITDIDDFKRINDAYGHIVGDQVIKYLAEIIKKHIRKTDFSFRYGGEEFVAILLNTDINNAERISEQIRKKIESTTFTLKDKTLSVTVTLGVAQYKQGETSEELIERADKKLYHGKETGKNKTVI